MNSLLDPINQFLYRILLQPRAPVKTYFITFSFQPDFLECRALQNLLPRTTCVPGPAVFSKKSKGRRRGAAGKGAEQMGELRGVDGERVAEEELVRRSLYVTQDSSIQFNLGEEKRPCTGGGGNAKTKFCNFSTMRNFGGTIL